MTKLRPVSTRILFKVLKKIGFVCVRTSGGHSIWEHPDGRVTVVPVHGREEIGKGLFMKILEEINLTKDEFEKLT